MNQENKETEKWKVEMLSKEKKEWEQIMGMYSCLWNKLVPQE